MPVLLSPAPSINIPFFDTVADRSSPGGIKIVGIAPVWYNWITDVIGQAAAAVISDVAFGVSWDAVTDVAPSKNAVYDKIVAMISDAAYGPGWNGVTDVAPSKSAVYGQVEIVIALIASSIATAIAAAISDTAFSSSWNGVTAIAPSKNAIYDKIIAMVSDDAYGPGWNGVVDVAPSKNTVYDKIEALGLNDPTTYSPTYGAITLVNCGAPTAYTTGYERRQNVVRVTGFFDATPTAAGLVQISISLPIASNLAAITDARGSGGADIGEGAVIYADVANNVAQIDFTALNNSAHRIGFHYEYNVLA